MKGLKKKIDQKTKELNLMAQQINQMEGQLRELKTKALRKDGGITALKELQAEYQKQPVKNK